MTAEALGAPRFDIGRVVKRAFGSIGRNLGAFSLLTMLLVGIPDILANSGRMLSAGAPWLEGGALQGLGSLINLVGVYVLQAALIHGVVADLNGRKASFGDCLATGFRFFLPVLAIAILTGLGVAVGLVLLIVPGVLLALAWAVNVPVEVVERRGVFGAFGRSAELTRGHRGAIFLLMFCYVIAMGIVSMVGLTLGGALTPENLQQGFSGATLAWMTVLNMIEGLIGAAGVASIYYELRSIKEGVGPEHLAAVFD